MSHTEVARASTTMSIHPQKYSGLQVNYQQEIIQVSKPPKYVVECLYPHDSVNPWLNLGTAALK